MIGVKIRLFRKQPLIVPLRIKTIPVAIADTKTSKFKNKFIQIFFIIVIILFLYFYQELVQMIHLHYQL